MNLFKVVEDEVIFKCISRQFAFLLNGLLMGTQKRAKAEMLSEIFFFSTQECIFSRRKGEKNKVGNEENLLPSLGATAFSAKMADKAIWGPKRASIIR